jgi:hypothetical protein
MDLNHSLTLIGKIWMSQGHLGVHHFARIPRDPGAPLERSWMQGNEA